MTTNFTISFCWQGLLMASSKLHDLVVHFNSNIRVIGNVDSDKYSFLELTNDIFKATVDDSNTGMGMSIVIQG